jgi:hypothetical protein
VLVTFALQLLDCSCEEGINAVKATQAQALQGSGGGEGRSPRKDRYSSANSGCAFEQEAQVEVVKTQAHVGEPAGGE